MDASILRSTCTQIAPQKNSINVFSYITVQLRCSDKYFLIWPNRNKEWMVHDSGRVGFWIRCMSSKVTPLEFFHNGSKGKSVKRCGGKTIFSTVKSPYSRSMMVQNHLDNLCYTVTLCPTIPVFIFYDSLCYIATRLLYLHMLATVMWNISVYFSL